MPLCQHADHAFHTDPTIVPLKLWGIVTELRGRQRAQLAELIEWQLQLFWQCWRRWPERWWEQPEYWRRQ